MANHVHLLVVGGEQRTFAESANSFKSLHQHREYEPPDFIFAIDVTKLINYKEPLSQCEEKELPHVNTVRYHIDRDPLI